MRLSVKLPDRRVIFSHLEMGDAIICNGLCRVLAKKSPVVFLTSSKYLYDVRRMYLDEPRIQVAGIVGGYGEVSEKWMPLIPDGLRLGSFASAAGLNTFDRTFYQQAGVPFGDRWASFSLPPELLNLVPPPPRSPFILVHEDPSRGFTVNRDLLPRGVTTITISRRESFWDWLPAVLAAAELHFIDSSFLNLAESLRASGRLTNTRMVWHRYAKKYNPAGGGPPELRAPWVVLG